MASNCDNPLSSFWPDDLYFVVPVSGSPYINAGGQIMALPVSFKGWKVRVVKNNIPMDYLDQGVGSPYFEQNTSSNIINLSIDAEEQDKFMIWAYKPIS